MNRYNPVHADAMVADEEGSHVLHTDYAALASELAAMNTEWAALLALVPAGCKVRVREGGGPEDIRASCAVSVVKMAEQLAATKKVLAWMTSAAERISSMPQEGTSENIARDLLRTAIGMCDDALKVAALSAADGGTR